MASRTPIVKIPDGQYLKECFDAVKTQFGWGEYEYDDSLMSCGGIEEDATSDGSENACTKSGTLAFVRGKRVRVPTGILKTMHHWVLNKAMGAFPVLTDASIVHFNEAMCDLLFQSDEQPDDMVNLGQLEAWELRDTKSGGHRAKVVASHFLPEKGRTYEQCYDGTNMCFTGVGGVPLVGMVVLVFLVNPFSQFEIIVGSARVQPPVGDFKYHGVCMPAKYIPRLIVHGRRVGVFSAFIQTNVPEKSLGQLENHPAVVIDRPRVSFTGNLSSSVNSYRTPHTAGIYAVSSAGPSRAIWCLRDVQYFGVAHFSLLTRTPIGFDVVVPGGYSGMRRYVTMLPKSATQTDEQLYDYMLRARLCSAWDGIHTPVALRGEVTSSDADVARLATATITVHTYEKAVNTSYTANYAGTFSNLPGVAQNLFPGSKRTTEQLAFL